MVVLVIIIVVILILAIIFFIKRFSNKNEKFENICVCENCGYEFEYQERDIWLFVKDNISTNKDQLAVECPKCKKLTKI